MKCSEYESFGQLLSRLEDERFAERPVEKVVIEDGHKHHNIELEAPLQLCTQENFRCKTVVFYLTELGTSGSATSSGLNALTS